MTTGTSTKPRKPRLTDDERERILQTALNLIREEANWTTGKWKCPVFQTDEHGNVMYEDGKPIPATDHNRRPLHEYCVEGAVNQATYNVVGRERAIKLGAVHENYDEKDEEWQGEYESYAFEGNGRVPWTPTELLGIDQIAFELYAEEQGWNRPEESDPCNEGRWAMTYNDDVGDHKGVVKMLRTGLDRIRTKIAAKTGVTDAEL